MADSLVTVVICVYNAGSYLRPSVLSALNQTYRNLEILIVNDGTTDGCIETIKDIEDSRLRIIHQKNQGKPAALNTALDQLRGEFYAIQDADDIASPRRIELQLKCMLENPDLAAAFCGYDLIIGNNQQAPISVAKDRDACRRDIVAFRMPSHDPTVMYRTSLVVNERYDASLFVGEGFDYILRVGECLPMMVISDCLYSYRIHPNSITKRSLEKRREAVLQVLRAASSRRGLVFEERFPHCLKAPSKPTNSDLDNYLAAHFLGSACNLAKSGKRWEALRVGLRCSLFHPLDPVYYKALVYALSPMTVLARRDAKLRAS